MKRTWIRYAVAAAALVAVLSLATPAQASGWTLWAPGPDLAQTARQWIARLWSAPEGTSQPTGNVPAWEKEGGYVDPNGQPRPMPPPDTPDHEGMVDPNG